MGKTKKNLLYLLIVFCFTVIPPNLQAYSQEISIIRNENDLLDFAQKVNSRASSNQTFSAELESNIDLTSVDWIPIGTSSRPFRGTLNGNGYTIKNLIINDSTKSDMALFGHVRGEVDTYSTVIENVNLEIAITNNSSTKQKLAGIAVDAGYAKFSNCSVNGSIISKNSNSAIIGGIVATGRIIKIENCRSNLAIHRKNPGAGLNSSCEIGGILGTGASIEIQNSYTLGEITAESSNLNAIGGIAGNLSSNLSKSYITNTYNAMTISISNAIQESYSDVVQENYVGGIVGYMRSLRPIDDITDCYNIAFITVDGEGSKNYVGGIVGRAASARIQNSYNVAEVTAAGSLVGAIYGHIQNFVKGTTIQNSYFNQDTNLLTESTEEMIGLTTEEMLLEDIASLLNQKDEEQRNVWYTRDVDDNNLYYPELSIFKNSENLDIMNASKQSITVAKKEPPVEDVTRTLLYGELLSTIEKPMAYIDGEFSWEVDAETIYPIVADNNTENNSYTLVFTPTSELYLEKTVTVKILVETVMLKIGEGIILPKIFDGTKDAEVDGFLLSGMVLGETLLLDEDFEIHTKFDSANVGTGKIVTVQITLLDSNSNYHLPDSGIIIISGQTILDIPSKEPEDEPEDEPDDTPPDSETGALPPSEPDDTPPDTETDDLPSSEPDNLPHDETDDELDKQPDKQPDNESEKEIQDESDKEFDNEPNEEIQDESDKESGYNPEEEPDELYSLNINTSVGGRIVLEAGGYYAENTTVEISAIPNSGYVFLRWTANIAGIFDDETSATTFVIMPKEAVTITAIFTQNSSNTTTSSQNPEPSITNMAIITQAQIEAETNEVIVIELSVNDLSDYLTGEPAFILSGEFAEIIVPAINFESLDRDSKISISFSRTQTELNPSIRQLMLEKHSFNESLLKNVQRIQIMVDKRPVQKLEFPIKVRVDLSEFDLTEEQRKNFTGILYGETTSTYRQLGGEFNEDGNIFTYYTKNVGDIFTIVSDDLCTIQFEIGETSYMFKGEARNNDVSPLLKDGQVMLPIRMIAEYIDANVTWNPENKTVGIEKSEFSLEFQLDTPLPDNMGNAFIEKNRTYVPAEYIENVLGFNIVWNDEQNQLNIYR